MARKNRIQSTTSEEKQIALSFEQSKKTLAKVRGDSRKEQTPMTMQAEEQRFRYIDMDDARLERRKAASQKYYEQARQLVEKHCPEIILKNAISDDDPEEFSFAREWGRLNAFPSTGYDGLNRQHYLTLGAAIWILDRINDYDEVPIIGADGQEEKNEYGYNTRRVWKLMQQLPLDDGSIDDLVELPHIYDPCQDDAILYELVYIIENRHDEKPEHLTREEQHEVAKGRYKEDLRPFMNQATVNGKHPDTSNRRAFDTIMSLIPEFEKKQAAEKYEKLMWAWMIKFFNGSAPYMKRAETWHKKVEATDREIDQLMKDAERMAKEATRARKAPQPKPAINPLLMNPNQSPEQMLNHIMNGTPLNLPGLQPFAPGMAAFTGKYENPLERLDRLQDQRDQYADKADEYLHNQLKLSYNMTRSFTTPRDILIREYGDELGSSEDAEIVADIYSTISIADPYELCFGLLYLIDSGSDLPWLYFPSVRIAQMIATHLPWYAGSYDEMDDEIWFGDDEAFEEDETEGAQLSLFDASTPAEKALQEEQKIYNKRNTPVHLPKSLRAPEIPDWYALDYENEQDGDMFRMRISLAQIIYEQTGAIMPRRINRYEPALRELARYGIKGQKALSYEMIMLLLGEGQRQNRDWRRESTDVPINPELEKEESTNEAAEENDPEKEQLRAELRALKRDMSQLRESIHDAQRVAQEEHKKADRIRSETEAEIKELHALREILFNQEIEEESTAEQMVDAASKDVYTVQKRMIVFGGHDSWLRAIKQMVDGDIRFVERGIKPNADMIRYADVVWIQPNSMSHADYYKVIDVVRTHHKRIEYFRYASAWKCVQQVMEVDE